MQQDFLYMFQASIGSLALVAVFLVFRYEIIDRYVDNRKEALRSILGIDIHPERAEWIQGIGKDTDEIFEKKLRDMDVPSVNSFLQEIINLRNRRKKFVSKGLQLIALWSVAAIMYLFAQIFNLYDYAYLPLMLAFLIPLLVTAYLIVPALRDSY